MYERMGVISTYAKQALMGRVKNVKVVTLIKICMAMSLGLGPNLNRVQKKSIEGMYYVQCISSIKKARANPILSCRKEEGTIKV